MSEQQTATQSMPREFQAVVHCIIYGLPFLGRETVSYNTMYYCLEDPDRLFKSRIRRLEEALEEPRERKEMFLRFNGIDPTKFARDLERRIVEDEVQFILVDTAFRALNIQDSNSFAETGRELEVIRRVALKHNIHVCFLHHNNKSGDGKSQGSILGSQSIAANPDHSIVISGESDEIREIRSVKHRYDPEDGGFWFTGETLCYDMARQHYYLGHPVTAEQKKILKALQNIKIISDALWETSEGMSKSKLRGHVREVLGKSSNPEVDEAIDLGLTLGLFYRKELKEQSRPDGTPKQNQNPIQIHPTWIEDRESYDEEFAAQMEKNSIS